MASKGLGNRTHLCRVYVRLDASEFEKTWNHKFLTKCTYVYYCSVLHTYTGLHPRSKDSSKQPFPGIVIAGNRHHGTCTGQECRVTKALKSDVGPITFPIWLHLFVVSFFLTVKCSPVKQTTCSVSNEPFLRLG